MLVLHSGEAQVPVTPKRPSDRPIIQNEGGGRTDASEEVVYGLDYVFIIIVQCSNMLIRLVPNAIFSCRRNRAASSHLGTNRISNVRTSSKSPRDSPVITPVIPLGND